MPIGIAAAHRPRLFAALRPVLDLMQTLPTFVYLIPTLVLFGLGVVPGLISTIIFAVPAPIRLTHLGISSVPRTLLEAGEAFGATPMQRLWKIELPSARPTILAGITQCIMLCLSMVVIAALVGAGGLGVPVVRALNSVQVDMGFEAGIAIVLLAIILDRISRPGRRRAARMSAAIEFRDVDILFPRERGRKGDRSLAAALAKLDAGATPRRDRRGLRRRRRRRRREPGDRAGRDLRDDGPVRLRQVDAAARGQRPQSRDARSGARAATRTDRSTSARCGADDLRRLRRRRIAMVFQQFGLLPWRTVAENVGLRARAARRVARRARSASSTSSSSWSASRTGPTRARQRAVGRHAAARRARARVRDRTPTSC